MDGGRSTDITLPDNLASLGIYAFNSCEYLTNIELPNSLIRIEQQAFGNCLRLNNISIPNSVTSLGYAAFTQCSGLANVILSENISKIEGSTFSGCTSLTSITLPDRISSIGSYAFRWCTSMTNMVLPASLNRIEMNAFQNCSSMETITFPEDLAYIKQDAFKDCSGLIDIYFLGDAPYRDELGYSVYLDCENATVYYLPGTTGWSNPWGGRPTVLLDGDLDDDGLPDEWELKYFGDTANYAATDHSDSDLQNNGQEYIAGTDPTNGASFFGFTNATSVASGFVLQWDPSVSNREYGVSWTNDLSGTFTSLVSGIEFPQNSYTDTLHGTDGAGFYKVEVQLK